jgi:protein-S-isoprenylcysteine O-methyltransferase Ste14
MSINTSQKQTTGTSSLPADVRAGVRHWLIKGYVGVLFTAAILFIPARRLDWVMGWVYIAIWFLWHTAMALILIPTNPELLAERAKAQKGSKTWDVVLLSFAGLTAMAQCIVAGFDARHGWTSQVWPQFPLLLQIVAAVVAALGNALGIWAMASNAFFSQTVRIQDDRGHTVATGGPYRYIRHPGYAGEVVFNLVTPVLLGSLWTFIPSVLMMLTFVVRTALEDRTLQEELDGYKAYAERVRYRLLPGIW